LSKCKTPDFFSCSKQKIVHSSTTLHTSLASACGLLLLQIIREVNSTISFQVLTEARICKPTFIAVKTFNNSNVYLQRSRKNLTHCQYKNAQLYYNVYRI
jgi:hypothetical protein